MTLIAFAMRPKSDAPISKRPWRKGTRPANELSARYCVARE